MSIYKNSRRFPFTKDGYKDAMAYLEETSRLHLIDKDSSTWTVVELAEILFRKDERINAKKFIINEISK